MTPPESSPAPPRSTATGSVRELLTITLIVSACSLLYELLIAQTVSLLAGNTVVWYSLTVGVYLGAMGLGAALLRARSEGNDWARLFNVELMLSMVGAGAVLLIHLAHSLHLFLSPSQGGPGLFIFFGVSLTLTVLVGLLSGIELPLLIRIGNDIVMGGKLTNRVLGWDYIGALVAGVAFPLALVPFLSLPIIGFATALTNLSVAAYVVRKYVPRDSWVLEKTVAIAALGGLFLVGISQGSDIQQYFLKRYYYHFEANQRALPFNALDDLPDVTRAYSPYQKIDLVLDSSGYRTDMLLESFSNKWRDDPEFPRFRFLFLNGDFQLSSSHEESYHEWFAHIPVILNTEAPERVLVMGAGDGLLMRELVKYDSIRSIKHVDLDRTLVELARDHPFLTELNRNALHDPRIETEFGDAFQYLRKSSERFDAIYLDFPYAKDYNTGKLYSREFFHFVREHLAEGGYAVLDAPGASHLGLTDNSGSMILVPGGEWEIYFNTIRAAGFDAIVPYRSTLEGDNPAATAFLEQWEGTPDFTDPETGAADAERRSEWIRQTVGLHRAYFREGFIVMWNGDVPGFEYRDLGVELAMLNERRFGLSFPAPFPASEIDTKWVNSILRPTLPTGSIWGVRRPWN